MKSIDRDTGLIRIILIGFICNIFLFGIKLYIGLVCGSISILTDSFNSLGDTITTGVACLCFFIMKKKTESKNLQYGYGRLEYVAALVYSVIISVIGIYFLFQALDRFVLSSPQVFKWIYFIIMVITIVVKAGMVVLFRFADKKYNSNVLKCAYYDSIIDIGLTTMSLISMVLMQYVQARIDAIFGVVVSVIMIVSGIRLCKDGLISLLGRKPDEKEMDKIKSYLSTIPGFVEISKVDYHDYGVNERFLNLQIIFNDTETISIEDIKEYIESNCGFITTIEVSKKEFIQEKTTENE